MKRFKICVWIGVFLMNMVVSGCSSSVEAVRKVWGSSIQTLQDERARAIRDVYSCEYQECYDLIKELGRKTSEDSIPAYQIFQERPREGILVVMAVPGQVDTTEVGIFLSRIKSHETAVEVSSLSQGAKRKVAESIRQLMFLPRN